MRKKLAKKKSSSPKKNSLKKKTLKKKPSVSKKRAPSKKFVKKKALVRKKSTPKKKTIKKKAPVRKKSTPKKKTLKKTIKKKAPVRKKSTPKKKTVKKKAPVRKKSTPKKKTIRRGTASARTKTGRLRRSKKYMNPDQLEYFRNILLSRRNELIDEADRTVGCMQSNSNTYADTIDQASQEEEFTLQLKERDRERRLLQKIDEALIKIDNHEYGFCVSCKAEIGINRLEARPTTDQCIDCKELDEIKERHL